MTEREQNEPQERDDDPTAQGDESPEEFAEEMESDPSRAPDDSPVDDLRGG